MFLFRYIASALRPVIEKYPKLAALYRDIRDQSDFDTDPIESPWGFKLAGNQSMAKGAFEPQETELVRDMLKNVDVLIDVGANVGYYCCHALSMNKKVIAFEPVFRNLRYLCHNIKINGWHDVEIYPIALSNKVDVLEIYGGDTGASILKGWAGVPESYKTLVPASTMDKIIGSRMRGKKVLIVIDIEGAEKWMLEGATMMLSNDPKPVWLIEITTVEHQPSGVNINPNFIETFQLFLKNGYQAFNVNNGLQLLTIDDLYLFASGKRVLKNHNFLFTENK